MQVAQERVRQDLMFRPHVSSLRIPLTPQDVTVRRGTAATASRSRGTACRHTQDDTGEVETGIKDVFQTEML